MSAHYVPVQWNRRKLLFDGIAALAIAVYLLLFQLVANGRHSLSPAVAEIRAFGTAAFLLWTFILLIGPLARLFPALTPILWNRRHLGVMCALLASAHGMKVLDLYYAWDMTGLSRIEALLTYDARFTQSSWPFVFFGVFALLILWVMAATSHDYWQATLGPRLWKGLHMLVYPAYAAVIVHLLYGVGRFEASYALLALLSGALVFGLHTFTGLRASHQDRSRAPTVEIAGVPYLDAGPHQSFAENQARGVIGPKGERIAVVRHADGFSALHGVCAHQGGPLAEGRVIDGCLTCPWHGWQYRPMDGQSPPPFEERLETYEVRIDDRGHVLVRSTANLPGTPCAPARPIREAP